ncbi:PREDICTED: protocadherin gamma-B7 [Condylura cristata]|uniref:protocadherin gamma-B7 n=1 Tax=Condylura cristata TaxID=143302 RepID=UPI000643D89F|nr:PREDICTED: protocadherin gamma-B7 [Condylura cristata]
MGGSCTRRSRAGRPQVLFAFLLSLFYCALGEPIRYSIPEELAQGSVVGNLAKDLGLSVRDVTARKLRVSAEKLLFHVDAESGDLLVKDRIDREQICRERRSCELQLEAVVENPLNVFHIVVVVEDINDHAPQFHKDKINLEISESVSPGVGTILDSARDPDISVNSLSKYQLSLNEYFSLVVKDNPDGGKYPELVLMKSLDRETQSAHHLVLTALDGGNPPRSGTVHIQIQVVDANDNAPVFSQEVYKLSLHENVPPGTSVLRVSASDQDEGFNSEITYSFLGTADEAQHVFLLDSTTGNIITHQPLDFEKVERYTMDVEAKDRGSLSTRCKVIIEILDENDNNPEIIITSLSDQILEDSPLGIVVALFKTRDQDSGENGEVTCNLSRDVPFKIHSSSSNYYKLVIDGALDREQTPEYNVTITATDRGQPPLAASTTFTLFITDINDNAPVFRQSTYLVQVPENNPPGTSIAQVSASDPDLGPNGHVSYSIVGSDLGPQPPLSATATLHLVFADSLQEALPDLSDRPEPSDPQAELQFYLVLALALISVLFLLGVILTIALRLRSPDTGGCFGSALCSKSGAEITHNYCEGTLPYIYNMCEPGNQTNLDFNFLTSVDHCPATKDVLNKDSVSVPSDSIFTPSNEEDRKTFKQVSI